MTGFRAFIAVNLSPDIQRRLDSISNQLKTELGPGLVRWPPAKNIHLTLKFLGDVSLANLDILKKLLESEASRIPAFELSVGGIGAFPSFQRPRVIWIGVQAPEQLSILQRSIDVETAALGYTSEARPFSPHLTLGRVSHNADASGVRKIVQSLEKGKAGNEFAEHTTLLSGPLRSGTRACRA